MRLFSSSPLPEGEPGPPYDSGRPPCSFLLVSALILLMELLSLVLLGMHVLHMLESVRASSP